MKIGELSDFLSDRINLSLQEDYDNSGLQIGDPESDIKSAILTLDVTEEVVDEAINSGEGLIISHHPLIFSGLKSITGKNSVERIAAKAIKNDIAIYSAHTNLDIVNGGVSFRMASKIGLTNVKVLSSLNGRLLKIACFVPGDHLDNIKVAMFNEGAGSVGLYDHCSFSNDGTGTFRATKGADPFIGELDKDHSEKEVKLEMILPDYLRSRVVNAMISAHPYEEVAYDIYRLENSYDNVGLGCYGLLENEIEGGAFLDKVAEIFDSRGLRYSGDPNRKIKTVALCGGAGSSLIEKAKSVKADIYITGDVKYHSFFESDSGMLIADIGHYESEKFSLEILYEIITKKFPKFAVRFSKRNTNPINYLRAWKK